MDAMTAAAAPTARPSPYFEERVLWVRHWTDSLFSFAVTRPDELRFRSGEFLMIGLPATDGAKPIVRAYSVASPMWVIATGAAWPCASSSESTTAARWKTVSTT